MLLSSDGDVLSIFDQETGWQSMTLSGTSVATPVFLEKVRWYGSLKACPKMEAYFAHTGWNGTSIRCNE